MEPQLRSNRQYPLRPSRHVRLAVGRRPSITRAYPDGALPMQQQRRITGAQFRRRLRDKRYWLRLIPYMTPDPLDENLAAYARQETSFCPPDLKVGIWREIERRRQQSFWTRLLPILEWREVFSEPRVAGLAFLVAIAIGIFPVAIIAKRQTDERIARESIHFDVFSQSSISQFSSLAHGSTSHSTRP